MHFIKRITVYLMTTFWWAILPDWHYMARNCYDYTIETANKAYWDYVRWLIKS